MALVLSGCADGEGDARGEPPRLTVAAAASLKGAFEDYGGRFAGATARFSFSGSDELAAQIRQGVKPDVYAAANAKFPGELFDQGLVARPVVFARNRLVLAVPADHEGIGSVGDLGGDGVKLAVGAESVPVGAYAREVLRRLPAAQAGAILANVRSNEPDVAGVVAKLAQGAADAGFVYLTDVVATRGRLRAIELPRRLRPVVVYAAAVVKGAKQPAAAREFIEGLRAGAGRAAMRRAGFEPPPRMRTSARRLRPPAK